MRIFFLIFFLTISSHAEDPEKEVRGFGGYLLETQRPCSDFSRYEECWPNTLPATITDSRKSVITTIPNVHYSHYHPFEVHGREIFWIARTGNISTKTWSDQLWVKKLASDNVEKLLDYQGIDFRASPDGKMVMFTKGNTISVLDRTLNSVKVLIILKYVDEGFTLLAWSADSSKFWFGAGDAIESWSRLALFKDGEVSWFPFAEGAIDNALEPEQGWLATSDTPFNYDVESEKAFKKSKTMTKLQVVDVFTGKRAVLAEAEANRYNPFWDSKGFLQYSIANKTFRISKSQIAEKLK